MEILSPLAKQGRFAALSSGGILDLKTIEFREGPLIEVVAGSVSFPTNPTPPNLES
jgi:hypothetical protein